MADAIAGNLIPESANRLLMIVLGRISLSWAVDDQVEPDARKFKSWEHFRSQSALV